MPSEEEKVTEGKQWTASHGSVVRIRSPDYGKRGAGNLTVGMRYGKDKRLRLLYCRTCHTPFLGVAI